MRPTIAAIVVLVFSVGVLAAQTPPLTLEAALRAARDSNRLLQAARLRILEARGDLTGASLRLADNPEIAGAAGPRLPGRPLGDRTTDIELGIEQRFETGGQRGFRLERAQAAVDAAAAGAADVQRVVDLAVARTFYETLAGERRLALLEQNETLARDLHGVATRRLDAGEGTPLEVNTARIRLADVERRAMRARAALETGTVRLASLIGLPPATPLQLVGDLPGDEDPPAAEVLVAEALGSRPDLAAATHQVDEAGAAVELADAEARPDLAVGAAYGREDGNSIVTAGLRVPLPFFDRNQGERSRARAARERLVAEEDLARLQAEAEVRQALLAYDQARRAVRLYDTEVIGALAESADLLQRAFEAGEVGLPEVLVVQRELLEGREGYLDATLELALGRADVLAATHRPQSGPFQGGRP
jgi:cobalt-zinc-cadmium efflux system outer membrane protein